MRFLAAAVMIAVAISGLSAQERGQGQGKPRVRIVDYFGPPSTLDQCVKEVPLIIVGTVVNSTQHALGRGDRAQPYLEHTIRVTDVIKGPSTLSPGQSLVVWQHGGVVVSDGIEVQVDDREFPIMHESERFILFLKPQVQTPAAYVPAWGPAGAFRINGNNIHAPHAADGIDVFVGKKDYSFEDLVTLLRTRVGK